MKRFLIILFLTINWNLFSQTTHIKEGNVLNNIETGTWERVTISRNKPTTAYNNNSISSIDAASNMLQVVNYGGIMSKSNSTTSTAAGVAYNIINDPTQVAIVVKAMTNFKIYNNTFYSARTREESGRGLVDIYTNYDLVPSVPSIGTKIFNNIFYTKHQIININVNDNDCLPEFESDYNVFYCEDGSPLFKINNVEKTFAQWQELGYDVHSVVVDPGFLNTTDFVPYKRLNYGTDLGSTWQIGLSTNATWGTTEPETAAQNGTWQVGARIYNTSSTIPVYTGSVVENLTPSRLEITYDLTLANKVPASSAFSVKVNSVPRTIKAVTISGKKVMLTLASPAVYGDIITVAYTKPSANALQTHAGGQAANLAAQPVTNRINRINNPPVVVIDHNVTNYSGLVNELNASKSYDPDNDNLTFEWSVPDNIPVSSLNEPIIRFLGPIIKAKTTASFTLKVTDGETIQTRNVQVEILPYKTEFMMAEILKIEASDSVHPDYPHNIIDGSIETKWAANGKNQWLVLQLKELFKIQYIMLAFQPDQRKEAYFDILGSKDNVSWEPILMNSTSCDFSGDLQIFDFPSSDTWKDFSYIKFIGQGNDEDSWNNISEFRVFGYPNLSSNNPNEPLIIIYPNPAQEYINISIWGEKSVKPDFIRIVNQSGVIVFENSMDPEINEIQIPLSLIQGMYFIQMRSGNITWYNQKLIVE